MKNTFLKKTELGFILPKKNAINRDNYILNTCREKKVLHLGCVDYPFLKEKWEKGTLLHKNLLNNCKELWGVDLDKEGVDFLNSVIPGEKIINGNIEKLNELDEIKNQKFDVIVAGEILEHINNLGLALQSINNLLNEEGVFIVSVPNALAIRIFYHEFFGRENIHQDHVVYFSPYTLTNLLSRYNFDVKELNHYWYPSTRKFVNVIKKSLYRLLSTAVPFLGDGIIILAQNEKK